MQRRVRRHRLIRWAGAALATAALGAGLAVAWPAPPREPSADVTFARDMAAHHAQAVTMSVSLLRRAADPEVRLLAQDILLTQQAQIGQMQGWLMAWGRPLAGREAPMKGMDRSAMGMASAADEAALNTLPVVTAETRYLLLMRRHHQGGVAMAKAALNAVRRPEVRAFAKRVVSAQTTEIQAIDAMLRARKVSVPPPAPSHSMDTVDHE
ncbi:MULTISPECIES: DUF305 domain-containing protein [Deinococcus]|uniref:DUF305 domain-containing protein n=2 Tax=Deinococcus TaxID=1298 RepID=A0A2T3W3H6_9DEIO|nr:MULTISPECIES: DUF305 domain-containing protein [Deinococcus]MBZ9715466.1 DUF305 domain-containing protein [Deinococcus multiflagellatus]PTA66427.1 DUF305 domain-containing protein [Deinococcus arcticus]